MNYYIQYITVYGIGREGPPLLAASRLEAFETWFACVREELHDAESHIGMVNLYDSHGQIATARIQNKQEKARNKHGGEPTVC